VSLLRPVRDTWSTSIALGRERLRAGGRRRILVDWIIQAIALLLVGYLVPGVLVDNIGAALVGAVVLGLLNALVRPVIILLTLPLSVLTVGLLSLVVNAMMLTLAAPLVPGFEVTSFASAFAAAIVITVFTTLISVALSANRDDTFYAELSRRLSTIESPRISGGDGLLIVQIDGLSAPILRNAIRVGLTPKMASWVRSGRYHLDEWECTPPSQTPASQAGILHGDNSDIPAFRWYEKERGRLMVANRPADAAEIERRLSNGKGLLAAGGISVGNLFSGDAERSLFTMSRMGPSTAADTDAFSLYFVDPGAFIRTIALTIVEVVREVLEARRQKARDIQPRVHRGFSFAALRAVSNVLLRDLNVAFLMHAMGRGTPIMYVDFVDYDELAHHAGPERLESLRSLEGVDSVLASLERAAAAAPRNYRIVVVSDHGQSQGETFLQRYGRTLEAVIRDLMGGTATSTTATAQGEGWGPVNALLSEIRRRPGVAGRVATSALAGRTTDGAVDLGREAKADTEASTADLVVGPSGNLANVYFPRFEGRATLEQIDERYPGLVAGLAAHPGIGFVLVRTAALGTVAVGPRGVHHLTDDRVDGEDPLTPFGSGTAAALRRLDGFPHVGDLLVNSRYDEDLDEVAAFEELVGSHGGFGGPQVRPFLLAPAELPLDQGPLVGAPAVHRQLVSWADMLGVGPGSGATASAAQETAPLPKPRAIGLVATWNALTGILQLVLGLSLLGLTALALGNGVAIPGPELPLVGGVLTILGLATFVVAIGLWRRRRWAWLATIVVQAISVIQVLLVVTSSGFAGIMAIGIVGVVMAPIVFFYLTRPHVVAAFGRRAPSRKA
jgi:uncharacterized membrane protein YvlD (DUF360 family)